MPKPLKRRIRNREYDTRRRREKPWRKLYTTARWQELREQQLQREPLCRRCLAQTPPRITPATVAHHIEPHRGDRIKFYLGPLASLCTDCHDRVEQGIEIRGYEIGVDADGYPIDPRHPWNRGRGGSNL